MFYCISRNDLETAEYVYEVCVYYVKTLLGLTAGLTYIDNLYSPQMVAQQQRKITTKS